MSGSDSTELLPLSQQETDVLNKHGIFFKKRVLQELQGFSGIGIVAEELGVSFGNHVSLILLPKTNERIPLFCSSLSANEPSHLKSDGSSSRTCIVGTESVGQSQE